MTDPLIERLEDLNKTLSRIANNFELYLSLYCKDMEMTPDEVKASVRWSLVLKEMIRDVRIEYKKGHKNGNR